MISLYNYEPALLARCLLGTTSIKTLNNALALCCTSKGYYTQIKTAAFFKGLVWVLDPYHPFLILNKTIDPNRSFKQNFWEMRNCSLVKTEIFTGMAFYKAFANNEGVGVVSFNDGIQISELKENGKYHTLVASNAMDVELNSENRVAFSDDYIAVSSGKDSKIYVFTAAEKALVVMYEIEEEVLDLKIAGDILYIKKSPWQFPEWIVCELKMHNAITAPNHFFIRCIGKDYLLYDVSSGRVYAKDLDLSFDQSLEFKPSGDFGQCYFFPQDDHFIEVFNNCRVFDITKLSIEEEQVQKTPISTKIQFQKYTDKDLKDVYFHQDRLIVTHDVKKSTSVSGYDTESGLEFELPSVPADVYKLDILCTAEKMYYLMLKQNKEKLELHLTTLNFGKI